VELVRVGAGDGTRTRDNLLGRQYDNMLIVIDNKRTKEYS